MGNLKRRRPPMTWMERLEYAGCVATIFFLLFVSFIISYAFHGSD